MADYVSVEELKSRLTITTQNHELQASQACTAASRAIEQHCNRFFYQTDSEARTFAACDPYKLKLGAFNDLVSVSSLETDAAGDGTFETTWASSDYQLLPHNPGSAPETRPYTKIRAVGSRTFPVPLSVAARHDRVQITGVWGWPAIPAAVTQAARILAGELFVMKDAPFGVADFGEQGLIRVRENPRLMSLLSPYRFQPVLVA